MKIVIAKAESGKFCMHASCKKESKFVTPKGRIKKGTVVAIVKHKAKSNFKIKEYCFYYCRSCIDQMLLDCKASLDSKLWVFS
jgi:hypothetical protein